MNPQKQLFRHRPKDGVFGDCHRTAIACVLDMDATEVPHFMDGANGKNADAAHDAREAWLNARGIATINVLFPGEVPLSEVLNTVSACNPRGRPVFILGGKSRNGVNHSVVACDGEIVCDPSQDESGIVGPCSDGFYWLTFFGSLQATAKASAVRWQAIADREDLEAAAFVLAGILQLCGAKRDDFAIAIGTGELHAYAPCPQAQWIFQRPDRVGGYPVEWHWGNVAALAETAA